MKTFNYALYSKTLLKDKKLAPIIKKVGPCDIEIPQRVGLFPRLARTIAYQQLTGKAAATIWSRVLDFLKTNNQKLSPEMLENITVTQLRSCGLSQAKALALLDLSLKCMNKELPTMGKLRKMNNEDVITALTSVRGIGPWSAQMFLIFTLGREDVVAAGDLGLRKGFSLIHKKKELVTEEEFIKGTQKWSPYRSIASWYLWRALEL